ncbi:hybrid sensor histidine kinase/response regulator [Nostoc sp. ATCC 53789]|jgi:signal transduction histidine kinase|uniref:hybrid sensor histidine kinase/response regulator n=1 Tax=Nostoc sp. ATCC 53789 TaxID=76335 RepID=UPI000DECE562|nr:hybrid sensor histidine kinase/response regulator [Nostoc sp. ATCC 53789]MBD2510527.1 hybrid sensor histidine kinase/response regulator [Desmonostoc muscorum FACHB-395]QHG19128.1 response regulator [Nostoc sp. ATCC 53789]RCJ18759.1 hybrid sensor histidine kinase/response regulator [Nostoc sp. ATCC 53789]
MSLTKSVKKDKILAVDDVFDNLLVLEAVLEDEGYEISLVEDSKIALAMVEESPPDIILLDVMMPEIDGYEFTRRIRQNPALPFIPILLLTAHYESSVVEGLDAGADDFIRKPFDPDELHARVRSLLRLKHSIDERDQMANLRADFVSRFTHDLRIPLVASNRVLKLLLEGRFCEVSPQLQEIIDTMIGSNQDLLEMVNTLLEVYRHEAGCKTLKISPCNIEELVSEVTQELTPLAEEKGLVVNIERDETASTVMGDRLELRRVLTNIIGNAIKFTDKGSVDIHCHLTPEDVTIDIQDTGPGISKQDQAILFERFRQGKHQRSGSGLGLYLSRCIIEAHQGTIDVTSEQGQGSTFTIRLPVAADN